MGRNRGHTLAAAVLAGMLFVVTACGDDKPSWQGGHKPTAPPPKASAAIKEPAADAKDVPASTGISFSTKEAVTTTVELKDAAGKIVEGKLSEDGKSWLPDGQLDYGATYTATVTATGDDNRPATATSTFTVMAKPEKRIAISSFLGDGALIGVGMPLMVRFGRPIPEEYRDDLQRRMTVTATPDQEGIWHWVSPTEVRYRPKTFWKQNSKIVFRVQAGGLPLGDNWYGRSDLTVDVKTGPSLVMTVDNRTKQMTVVKNGKVIRKIPVSLGKPSTPSSSGTMIVIEKKRKTIFDTRDDPNPANRYVTDIEYAQRLTWGGEYIHSAPWSVAQQGKTNVSHGCVNMSAANAAWLFGQTRVGDPITVKGTERKLENGNGWTDWNMSWEEYVKGSAIPYSPPAPKQTAEPTEEPVVEPTGTPGT